MADINTSHDLEKHEIRVSERPTSATFKDSQVLLTLEQFRVLVGIPQDSSRPLASSDGTALPKINGNTIHAVTPHVMRRSTIENATRSKPRILILLGLIKRPRKRRDGPNACDEENEYPTSLYYALKQEETDQWSQYHLYNGITYTCLVAQLVIASALIVIGAIPVGQSEGSSGHRIAIAILGAVTGLLTGILSLLKGQGLPNRFLQYASRLREVRTQIEFKDRILRSGASHVTYGDVLDILDQYETVLDERDMNRPDTWATQSKPQKEARQH